MQKRNSFFIEGATNSILEIDPRSGKVKNKFSINIEGNRDLNIFGGTIEVEETTKTLYVATNGPEVIRVFTFKGDWVRDYDLSDFLENRPSLKTIQGLTFDDQGDLWVAFSSNPFLACLRFDP